MLRTANRTSQAISITSGALDTRPTVIDRNFGLARGIGGWLLTPFLQKIGPVEAQKLRERVVAELKTTFASGYACERASISTFAALRSAVSKPSVKRSWTGCSSAIASADWP